MFDRSKLPEKPIVGLDNIYNDSRTDLKAKKLHVLVGVVNISYRKLHKIFFYMCAEIMGLYFVDFCVWLYVVGV